MSQSKSKRTPTVAFVRRGPHTFMRIHLRVNTRLFQDGEELRTAGWAGGPDTPYGTTAVVVEIPFSQDECETSEIDWSYDNAPKDAADTSPRAIKRKLPALSQLWRSYPTPTVELKIQVPAAKPKS